MESKRPYFVGCTYTFKFTVVSTDSLLTYSKVQPKSAIHALTIDQKSFTAAVHDENMNYWWQPIYIAGVSSQHRHKFLKIMNPIEYILDSYLAHMSVVRQHVNIKPRNICHVRLLSSRPDQEKQETNWQGINIMLKMHGMVPVQL